MFKVRYKIFTVAFILFFSSFGVTFSQNKVKNVVIFFALNANLPAYQNLLEGIKSTFNNDISELINLDIVYLDVNRFTDDASIISLIRIYEKKYSKNLDLLITVGPELINLLKKYDFKLLETSPVINIDIDIPGRISAKNFHNKDFIDIVLKYNLSKTLKSAFDLFPANKKVYVICGNTITDNFFASLVSDAKKEFEPGHNFIFVSKIPIDSTLKIVKGIQANSLIIVPSYLSDNNDLPFSTPEALRYISYYSKAPVFPITDGFIMREGGIGGYVFSYNSLGKETGQIATEMLNGKHPSEIKLNENSFYQYIYDWQQLKKWGLVHSGLIPKESIFFNKKPSFFTEYQWYIFGLVLFIVSQTLLILYLFKLNRRQKLLTEQILETETLHRELIREDRLAKMTELTASLSHELNQPLSAILFSAQAGKRFLQSGKLGHPQAEEIFNNIIEDDKRAGEIISSVKSLMKLENREKEHINLISLIHETINIIHSESIIKRVKLELKLDNDTIKVFCDKIQIQQVLMNFIRNAIQSMEKNDYENRILEIVQQSEKNSVTVTVRDSGPGVDEAILEKLFKPFVTTNKKGFGIGEGTEKVSLIRVGT